MLPGLGLDGDTSGTFLCSTQQMTFEVSEEVTAVFRIFGPDTVWHMVYNSRDGQNTDHYWN